MTDHTAHEALSTAEHAARLFDSGRLRQARRLELKTKQALAAEVGVSAAAIGQYESGVTKPRPDVLERLATALDVPPAFFAAGRPMGTLDSSDAHFKALRATTAGQRNKALAYTEQVWELVHVLERWVQFPPLNLPDDQAVEGSLDRARIRAAAERLRACWNVDLQLPFAHLTRHAEANGIIVVFAPFVRDAEPGRVSAFSTSKLPRPIVVTPPDRHKDVSRHRFNLAHELGHFALHQEEVHGEMEIEREADAFARELLMPEKAMRNALSSRIEWDKLARLSEKWGVEMKELIYRSRQLEIISEPAAKRAYQRFEIMKKSGVVAEPPTAAYLGELPSIFQRAFEHAEAEGASVTSIARDLAWHPKRVRELLGQTDQRPTLRALL